MIKTGKDFLKRSKILISVFFIFSLGFTFTACSDGGGSSNQDGNSKMVKIPPGIFNMGSPTTESGRSNNEKQHQVSLTSGFYIGKYQVTQKQWKDVMGEDARLNRINTGNDYGRGDNFPMFFISWYDVLVYCNMLSEIEKLSSAYEMETTTPGVWSTDISLWGTVPEEINDTRWNSVRIVPDSSGYRMPTEAQWEYACRAGKTTAYNDGSDNYSIPENIAKLAWYYSNSDKKTHEVGQKAANAWGLYDMHGNLDEWCWDWYGGDYDNSFQTRTNSAATGFEDPAGPSTGTNRVRRGGGWNTTISFMRSASRNSFLAYSLGGNSIGFRLIRPLQD